MDKISVQHGKERLGSMSIPDNIAQYFNDNYCTVEVSICKTDVENGYGCRISKCLKILRPYCKCSRCGYHSLFNPDDSKSRCLRHTYTKGWDVVFAYTLGDGEKKKPLEDAFDSFLQMQSNNCYDAIKPLYY